MPGGETIAGDTYLFAFGGADQNGDLETAAGNAAGSSGAGQYNDNPGALFDGINALGGQGDAYDPHVFPISDPVSGLLLEDGAAPGNEAPTLDLAMNTVTFVSEDAQYNNMIGVYELDGDGRPINPEIILLDSNTATPGEVLTTMEDGQTLHYFLVVGADAASGPASFSQDPGTGEWSISFAGDPDSYEVRFDSASINGYTEPTFQFTINAQGRVVAVDDQLLEPDDDDDFNDTIIQENANAGTGYSTLFQGTGAVHITGEANISDADSTNMSQAVVTLRDAQSGDTLSILGESGTSGTFGPGINFTIDDSVPGVITITLSGDYAISDYEEALEAILFNNSLSNPDGSDRHIDVQVWDNNASPTGAASNTATAVIGMDVTSGGTLAASARSAMAIPQGEDGDVHAQMTGNLLGDYGDDASAVAVDAVAGAWGALSIAANGDWSYTPYSTPDADVSGLDHPAVETFTYQVNTADGGTETATLYVPAHVDASVVTAGTENNDVVYGDDHGSTISGLEGNDFLYGGEGADHIDGGAGHDFVNGGAGNDVLNGGHGNDYIFGGSGDDTIQGGDGNDVIWGGAGNDVIDAGAGDDNVFVSSGNDTVTLGEGADTVSVDPTYLTHGSDGSMTITDFNIGEGDHLDLSGLTSGMAEITSGSTSGDLVLTISDANHAGDSITITLEGVMPASHADVTQSMDISSSGDEINHLIQHIISTGGEHTT
jgi:VCBS repeat-containing protein